MWRVWLGKIWHFLSQLRLGVILLASLLSAVVIGTLFPQLPQQADKAAWWEAVRDRYGSLYVPLRALGLFDLFGALWFQGLLALLLLSTVACFLRRVWPLSQVVLWPRIRLPIERFERAAWRAQLTFPSTQAAESALQTALQGRRYRVQVERQARFGDPSQYQIHLRADRHRLPRLGTLLTHIGLVSLLLSGAFSGLLSWRVPALGVNSLGVTPVGHGTGVELKCDQFTILRHNDGTPRDYWAEVTLSDEIGRQRTRGRVQVNKPLTYGGVSYHLQGYHLPSMSTGSEDGAQFCDVTLIAVHDPGYSLVIAAGFCLLVGVMLTFHFPHRRLWARIGFTGETSLAGSTAWDRERFTRQFETLVAELREMTSLAKVANRARGQSKVKR
jgi:cytochrome c biogenesis protein ResB